MKIKYVLSANNELINRNGSLFIANLMKQADIDSLDIRLLGSINSPILQVTYSSIRVNDEVCKLVEDVNYSNPHIDNLRSTLNFNHLYKDDDDENRDIDRIIRKSILIMRNIANLYERFCNIVKVEENDNIIIVNNSVYVRFSYTNIVPGDEMMIPKLFSFMLNNSGICSLYNMIGLVELINQVDDNINWGIPHIIDKTRYLYSYHTCVLLEDKPNATLISDKNVLNSYYWNRNVPLDPLDILVNI